MPFEIDWGHPAVQSLVYTGVQRTMDVLFPGPPRMDPYAAHLQRVLERLDAHLTAGGPRPAQETTTASQATPKQVSGPTPYSAYLSQEGADQEWDTGCLPCGRAHMAAVQGLLEQARDVAGREGPDSPRVRKYVAEANREITALFLRDWTPERIAAAPPEHRAVIERYIGPLKQLQANISSPVAADATAAWSMLDEATRFAHEDGVEHPEVQTRLADAEVLAVTAERHALSPESIAELPPEKQEAAREAVRNLRRVRQQVLNGIATPQDLDVAATEAARVVDRLGAITYTSIPSDRLDHLAAEAAKMRTRFREDAGRAAAPLNRVADMAAAVASGTMTREQAAATLQGAA